MSTDYSKQQAICVVWVDSAEMHGWQCKGYAEDQKPLLIYTIGYLMAETPEYITVTSSVTEEGATHSPMTIPWKAIKTTSRL